MIWTYILIASITIIVICLLTMKRLDTVTGPSDSGWFFGLILYGVIIASAVAGLLSLLVIVVRDALR